MKQKIEWYREVLELEPGSRVFFPLARLLAADGQNADAVSTLRQGLLRHPDHVEARLLLVELLLLQQENQELGPEIDVLGKIFAAYPGFWQAWSENLAASPKSHDAALALRFFAAVLQGKEISWGAVVEQGLQSLFASGDWRNLSLSVLEAEQTQEPAVPSPHDEDAFQADAPEEDDDTEEPFSLRTRSMAEVLAEQGDIAGALDIYTELMQRADAEERASLEARAVELAQRSGASGEQNPPDVKSAPPPGAESTRLVSLLESLAERLEARAR